MKVELSKREKWMIFILGALIFIFVVAQFGIIPMLDRYDSGQEELYRLITEREKCESNVAIEDLILNGNKEAHEQYKALKKKIPSLMPNEVIDYILTNLCLENQLKPIMLNISDPVFPKTEEASVFVAVTANMNLSGSLDALENMITALEAIEYIRMTSVRYSTGAISGRGADTSNISVAFEFTLLNERR